MKHENCLAHRLQAAAMHRMAEDPIDRESFADMAGCAEGVLVALANKLMGDTDGLQVRQAEGPAARLSAVIILPFFLISMERRYKLHARGAALQDHKC